MLDFRPITLADQPIVERHLQSMNVKGCDSSFSDLFIWRHYYNYHIYNCERFVFIRGGQKGSYNFLLPIGEGDKTSCFDRLSVYCREEGLPLVMVLVEEPYAEHIPPSYLDRVKAEPVRDTFDYCYLRQNLAFLRGNSYSRKRNHINKFIAEYGDRFTFEPLASADFPEALEFARFWADEIGLDPEKYAVGEGRALEEFFANYETLHARGALIRLDGRIVAFTAGSPHHPGSDCFITHFEKSLRDLSGGYTVINKLFAEQMLSDFTWINREDDMGLPSLRKSKESYFPDLLLPKYRLEVLEVAPAN